MLKIIFRIFRKQMLRYAALPHNVLEPQTRFNDTDRFRFVFYDKEGLAYYECINPKEMPIARQLYATIIFTKFYNAINDEDISLSLDAIQKAILRKNHKELTSPDIARIGYICQTLLSRKGKYLSEELLIELAAAYYIREDEAIEVVNEEKFKEKVHYLSLEGDKVKTFFYSQSYQTLFPYIEDMSITMNEAFQVSKAHFKAYSNELMSYLNGR